MDNVKAFCLLNGRELIATVKDETDTHFVLTHAVAFGFRDEGNGQIGIVPQPVSFLAERNEHGINVSLAKAALAYDPFDPNTDVLTSYNQIKSPIQIIQAPAQIKGQFTRN